MKARFLERFNMRGRWSGGRKKKTFGCVGLNKTWSTFFFLLSSVWACFHSQAAPQTKPNGVTGTWQNVLSEGCKEGEGVCWEGWRGRGRKTEIELFVSLFWAPLPLLQMSIHSPPSSKCWGCRWPTEESTYQSLAGHLPICLPIYSSAHLMTIHPAHSPLPLPLLHLSDNQPISRSICAPIQQFIYPSICLAAIQPFVYHPPIPSIHLSSHPSVLTLTDFHMFQAAPSNLHLGCLRRLVRKRGGEWFSTSEQLQQTSFSINTWKRLRRDSVVLRQCRRKKKEGGKKTIKGLVVNNEESFEAVGDGVD